MIFPQARNKSYYEESVIPPFHENGHCRFFCVFAMIGIPFLLINIRNINKACDPNVPLLLSYGLEQLCSLFFVYCERSVCVMMHHDLCLAKCYSLAMDDDWSVLAVWVVVHDVSHSPTKL